MPILTPHAPQPKKIRALPLGYRHTILAEFENWVQMSDTPVPYFNNLYFLPRDLIADYEVSFAKLFETLPQAAFDEFMAAAGPDLIEQEVSSLCCLVEGEIRRDFRDGSIAHVRFEVEDVLLTRHAFTALARDVRDAAPSWVPFFFRGGVPPGLAIVGEEFHRVYPHAENSVLLERLHWFPGLGDDKCGVDTKRLFFTELSQRLEEATEPCRVWAVDTTLTGSSAPQKILNIVNELPSELRARLELTLAMVVPIAANVSWAHNPNNAELVAGGIPVGVAAPDGRCAILRKLAACDGLGGLQLRVYAVRNSLSEDRNEALEMEYLPASQGKPVFGIIFAEHVELVIAHGDKEHRQRLDKNRGDSAYDWLFNEFNRQRLRRALRDLGFPEEPSAAVEALLSRPEFEQYRQQGRLLHPYVGD